MDKYKYFFSLILLYIFLNPLFAVENIYNNILNYRYKNDPDLVLIENEAQIALNNYKSIRVNSLFTFDLDSTLNITLNTDKKNTVFSFKPSVSASMPLYNNLGFKFSMPYLYSLNEGEKSKGLSFLFSGDIYSQNRKKIKHSIEAAYDNLKAARKRLNMRKELAEKKLLIDIQTILNEYLGLLTKKLAGIQANINYRQVLAQGYAENSSKLRTSKLALMSAEREEKELEFSFEISAKLFFESCGLNIEKKDGDEFFINLAKAIPEQKLISLKNLNAENYSLIIKAEKDYKKLIEQNKINLSPFSASASLGFSYTENKKTVDDKSVNSGVSLLFPGIKLYTGVNFPLKEKMPISMQISFSLSPLAIYDYHLNKKNANLSELNEKIKLDELKRSFANEFKTFNIQWEKLEWQKELYAQELGIYKENADEHEKWFKRGLVNSLENMQANLEYIKALIRLADSNINVNVFNVRIKELFELEEE